MARLGFSEGYRPIICIGLGYADETPEAKPRDMGKVRFIESRNLTSQKTAVEINLLRFFVMSPACKLDIS